MTTNHTRHLYDGVLLVLYVAALVASGVNFGSLSGVLQVSLEVTSMTTNHTRHLYDGVLLVLYVAYGS